MRRLSAARDRELRHAYADQVAWRSTINGGVVAWYAWCRICGRNATKQVEYLLTTEYLVPLRYRTARPVSVEVNRQAVEAYLRRYPR